MSDDDLVGLEPVMRMSRDMKRAAITMGHQEARFLVDAYYKMQDDRIRGDAQIRATGDNEEPHDILVWLAAQSRTLEQQIKGGLTVYAGNHPAGAWAMSQKGLGGVLTAGLLAHIDITRAPTVGHIWSYAGLVPGVEWKKGEKRPWNADLKKLCWKIGESFVKVSGYEGAYYGKVYAARKTHEVGINDRGLLSDQAAAKLERFNIGKTTDAYKAYSVGKLPPAHIHARAKRYAVKLFLSHFHAVWYEHEHGTPPPLPYPIAHLQHVHHVDPPREV